MNYDYYLGVVKHLIIANNYWNQWAEETLWEWDYYPLPNDDLFFYEMCYLYHIL